MSNPIGETLLEMHYFGALREHFATILGLPNLRILKPTPRREKWLGFDQAFVTSTQSGLPLERSLSQFIHSNRRPLTVFRAVFMQFKVVEQRRSRRGAPPNYAVPWFAAELSTKKDPDTKNSQHETLTRLAELPNTFAAYACPMLFSLDDILRPADLTTLRQIDVRSAPSGWLTDGQHKLAFLSPSSDADWCSDPTPAKELDLGRAVGQLKPMNGGELLHFLVEVRDIVWSAREPNTERHEMPLSLLILAD
jgi:hypothetical protein